VNLILTIIAIVIWGWLAVIWTRRIKARREIERLSITPEALHDLLATHHDVLVLDVRQPLDLVGRLRNYRRRTEDLARGRGKESGSYPQR